MRIFHFTETDRRDGNHHRCSHSPTGAIPLFLLNLQNLWPLHSGAKIMSTKVRESAVIKRSSCNQKWATFCSHLSVNKHNLDIHGQQLWCLKRTLETDLPFLLLCWRITCRCSWEMVQYNPVCNSYRSQMLPLDQVWVTMIGYPPVKTKDLFHVR